MIRATKKSVLGNKFAMKNHIKNGTYKCEFDNLLLTALEKRVEKDENKKLYKE